MLRRLAIKLAVVAALVAAVWVYFLPPAPYAADADQSAQYLSSLTWTQSADWFGGFSGLEISADGLGFVAVTDRGHIVHGTLQREDDMLIGVTVDSAMPLLDDKGVPTIIPRVDAEGLAQRTSGEVIVSFEGVDRVWAYDAPGAPARWESYSTAWRTFNSNGGMEALAVDDQNTLFTIVERPGRGAEATLIYRRAQGEKWQQPFVLPIDSRFRPVGADFGPDGRLFILERDVYPFGFRSRVRTISPQPDNIQPIETVLETPLRRHGNLEGIAIWTDTQGRTRLTMIADDNFLPVQRTEIVEYVLR